MEYCHLHGVDIESHSTLSRGLRQKALDEYLIKGGMPEIANETEYAGYIKGLVKGAEAVGCDKLKLIIMEGDPGVETIQNKKIDIVKAADWLLKLD